MNSPPRINTRPMTPVEKMFVEMHQKAIMAGYENSKSFATSMTTIIPAIFTIYTGLTAWLLAGLVSPFPEAFYLIPATAFVIALMLSIYTLKPVIQYASPDTPSRIRENYIAVMERRNKLNMMISVVVSLGLFLMVFFLFWGVAGGTPKESAEAARQFFTLVNLIC